MGGIGRKVRGMCRVVRGMDREVRGMGREVGNGYSLTRDVTGKCCHGEARSMSSVVDYRLRTDLSPR